MKQYIFTFSTVFVAVLLAVFVSGLVGNQSAFGGTGITRFPNSGQAMRYLTLTATPGTVTSGTDGQLTATAISNSGTFTQAGAMNISGGTITVASSSPLTNTQATTTLGCLKIYQVGATTAASSTYWLVASSTLNTDNFYPLFATSTKPAYCR